jgi:hypothetical protein
MEKDMAHEDSKAAQDADAGREGGDKTWWGQYDIRLPKWGLCSDVLYVKAVDELERSPYIGVVRIEAQSRITKPN